MLNQEHILTKKEIESLKKEIDFLELSPAQSAQIEGVPLCKIRQIRRFNGAKDAFLTRGGKVDFLSQHQVEMLFREIYYNIAKIRPSLDREEVSSIEVQRHITAIREAIEEIFLAHRALILKMANRFRWIGESLVDDLIQDGSVALLKAIKRYDPTSKVPFLAYAKKAVYNTLKDSVDNLMASDTLLSPVSGNIIRVAEMVKEFKTNGDELSDEDISTALGVPRYVAKSIRNIVSKMNASPYPFLSMDEANEDGLTLHDSVGNQNEIGVDVRMQYNEVIGAIRSLPYKERTVLEMHLLEGRTVDQIGAELKLTRSRVQQIEVEAISILRRRLKIKRD